MSDDVKTVAGLVGKTLSAVHKTKDELIFTIDSGERYKLFHEQDCCENVSIEDVCGDVNDLVGAPILKAEESRSNTNPAGITPKDQDSFTWTFYHFATIKGYVTVRWYGESNGYYSESVDFGRAD